MSGLVTPEPVVGTWGGDPALPGPDGALIMGVRRGFPEDTDLVLQALTSATPTIVLGAPTSDRAIVDLRRAGAKQVLARDCSPSDLVQAVQSLRRVRPSVRRQPTGPTEPTARELEVTTLLAQGLSNREIAERVSVSENTVKTHSSRVFDKLGARRRTQGVQLGKELRLIP